MLDGAGSISNQVSVFIHTAGGQALQSISGSDENRFSFKNIIHCPDSARRQIDAPNLLHQLQINAGGAASLFHVLLQSRSVFEATGGQVGNRAGDVVDLTTAAIVLLKDNMLDMAVFELEGARQPGRPSADDHDIGGFLL